jgi:non-specific serine/threonine protein kinase
MEAAVRARHATYFLEFAERAGAAAAHGPVRIPWLEVLERDHDNLREALRWTTDHIDDESTRVRWAGALGPLWHLRGHVSEGRAWLTALGVTPERAQPTLHWARALTQASILHSLQGAFDVALECFDAAVPIARSTGDSETLMRLLINVGAHLITRGEFVRAGGLLEEALATSRRTGDRVREALSLEYLAILAYRQGDYPSAQAHCYACLTIASQLQDPVTESDSRRILGHIALRLGDASTARAEYEISLAHARAAGYRVAVALALLGLGQAAYAVGDRIRARAILAEGVATARELGLEYDIATALLGFGALAADMNEPSTALRIASAAARVQRSFSSVLPTLPSAAVERALARAKQTVGPDVAAEATLRGQTDSIEESLRLALELDPTVRTPGPLSSREMQVARLIEQGLTNREIAARLIISQRTAATHVEHILAKLNLHSRIEVALWMSTRGEQESAH